MSRRKNRAWVSIMMNAVEVSSGGIIIGTGLIYFDGRYILKPDIVSLTGELLPAAVYNLTSVGEPQLVVLARNVQ